MKIHELIEARSNPHLNLTDLSGKGAASITLNKHAVRSLRVYAVPAA